MLSTLKAIGLVAQRCGGDLGREGGRKIVRFASKIPPSNGWPKCKAEDNIFDRSRSNVAVQPPYWIVIPSKAGFQSLSGMDPRFRGDDDQPQRGE